MEKVGPEVAELLCIIGNNENLKQSVMQVGKIIESEIRNALERKDGVTVGKVVNALLMTNNFFATLEKGNIIDGPIVLIENAALQEFSNLVLTWIPKQGEIVCDIIERWVRFRGNRETPE
jgi:hypothetical protein